MGHKNVSGVGTPDLLHTLLALAITTLERDPALAARARAVLGLEDAAGDDWIPIARAPLAKKTARRLARTGTIAAKKVGGRLYLSRASLDAYMRERGDVTPIARDDDDDLRATLGLRRVS